MAMPQPPQQTQVQARLTIVFLLDENGTSLIEADGDLDKPLLYLAAIEALAQAVQDWFISP